MISQITPEGLRPASRATSTAASVWPVRTSTPPSRATSGKTWPGGDDILRALGGVDGDGDGAGAIGGADPGGDALARLDGDREGGLVARAVMRAHQVEAELRDAVLRQRKADEAAAVHRHEIDRVGRRHLGGNDEIAFILAILVVDQDEHAPVARFVDDLLGGCQRRAMLAREQIGLQLAERIGGRVPVALFEASQAVGMKPGGAGEARAGKCAFADEATDFFDQVAAHGQADITLQCDLTRAQITSDSGRLRRLQCGKIFPGVWNRIGQSARDGRRMGCGMSCRSAWPGFCHGRGLVGQRKIGVGQTASRGSVHGAKVCFGVESGRSLEPIPPS